MRVYSTYTTSSEELKHYSECVFTKPIATDTVRQLDSRSPAVGFKPKKTGSRRQHIRNSPRRARGLLFCAAAGPRSASGGSPVPAEPSGRQYFPCTRSHTHLEFVRFRRVFCSLVACPAHVGSRHDGDKYINIYSIPGIYIYIYIPGIYIYLVYTYIYIYGR